jgi:hypothetical protein
MLRHQTPASSRRRRQGTGRRCSNTQLWRNSGRTRWTPGDHRGRTTWWNLDAELQQLGGEASELEVVETPPCRQKIVEASKSSTWLSSMKQNL